MSEESRKMAKLAVEALDDKKAEDVKVIDISKVSVSYTHLTLPTIYSV